MRKVRIKGLPKKAQGGASNGSSGLNKFMNSSSPSQSAKVSAPDFDVNRTISGVPAEEANVEAEGGEFAVVPGMGGIPESYTIMGPRHNGGGVPLNLAPDSFIFSDHKNGMKIKDKDILAEFGVSVPKKGRVKGKTPAELAKKFDLNPFKKILMDPDSDKTERETAERMIKNYNLKLGKLALVQESMKGFPQGIPVIAQPYMQTVAADPNQFMPQMQEQDMEEMAAAYGMEIPDYAKGGGKKWLQNIKSTGQCTGENFGGPECRAGTRQYAFAKRARAGEFSKKKCGGENKRMAKSFPGLNIAQEGGEMGAFWESIMQEGGGIPGYQEGGPTWHFDDEEGKEEKKPEVTTSKTAPAYKIPKKYKEDPKFDETSDKYDPKAILKGDYIKKADGKWYKATGLTYKDVEFEPLQDIPEAYRTDYSRSYALLENTFKDPENKDMIDEFYKKYQDRIEKSKIKDPKRKEALMNKPKEAVIENFLKAQKQIYTINTLAADDPELQTRLTSESMDKTTVKDPVTGKTYGKNEAYADILKSTGKYSDEDIMSDDMIAMFQGAYQGLVDISMEDDYKEKMESFNLKPVGMSDEDWSEEWANVSEVDDWFGNTTVGQAAIAEADTMGFEEAELMDPEKPGVKPPPFVQHVPRDEWWAQDIMNIGQLAGQRLGLKKYLPTSFPVDLARPDVLYYDPSRALAASAEQANIASQAASAFAGPQATGRMSDIAGQTFAQQANILADYEARNVGIGNQYLQSVKQTADTEAMANADRLQKLYDQGVISNQQFDNARRATNRNLFEGIRQGLTNKKMTQAMHAMYPQFETRPGVGGGMYFTGQGRPFQAAGRSEAGDGSDYLKNFEKLKSQYPGASDAAIKQQLDVQYSNQPSVDPRQQQESWTNMYRGINNPMGVPQGATLPGMYPVQ